MSFNLADIERRIAALEKNRGASLRFGTVTESDQATGAARVQLADGDGMVSYPLRVLQRRSLKDKAQCMPDLGEPVACLFAGQGMEQGAILGACYSTQTPPPGVPGEQDYMVYEDGTELWYDRKNHKLIAKVKGDAEVETEGHISATAKKEIRAESATTITLKAPIIALKGLLRVTDKDGNPGSGDLSGNYRIRQGSLSVPDDNISTGQQLIAAVDAVVNGISFVNHEHEGVMPGSGVSGVPIGGGSGTGGGSSDPNNTGRYEEDFNALYTEPPEDATEKDKLLLCLPEIAAEEAESSWLQNDKTGWLQLRAMFHKWFSGPVNTDAESSPEVFWVTLDWIRSYIRGWNGYHTLINNLFIPLGEQQLAQQLFDDGYLGTDKIFFDYTKLSLTPASGERPWREWKHNYFRQIIVNDIGAHIPDGLTCCMGMFNLRAVAAGYTEPLPAGGHKITVEKVSVFVWDSFNFDGKDQLGYWSCHNKDFSFAWLGDTYTFVYNMYFHEFRSRHGLGHDFMVLSEPDVERRVKMTHLTEQCACKSDPPWTTVFRR